MKVFVRGLAYAGILVMAAAHAVGAQITGMVTPLPQDEVRRIVAELRESLPRRGEVLYYLHVRSDTTHSLTILQATFDTVAARALADRLAALPGDTAARFTLLEIKYGDSVVVRSEPARVVRPEPKNQAAVQRKMSRLAKDLPVNTRVAFWLFVDREGRVSKTMVAKGTGNESYDNRIAEVARELRFSAAQVNGRYPMPVWVEIPFHINTGGT